MRAGDELEAVRDGARRIWLRRLQWEFPAFIVHRGTDIIGNVSGRHGTWTACFYDDAYPSLQAAARAVLRHVYEHVPAPRLRWSGDLRSVSWSTDGRLLEVGRLGHVTGSRVR